MKVVHFYISNSNHHWQMMKPIIREVLKSKNVSIKLISLCGFRRMETPAAELANMGVNFEDIASLKFKGATTSTGQNVGGSQGILRKTIRAILWLFWVMPDFVRVNKQLPDLVIVPNDIAFPFDRMCKWFRNKKIRFMLIQEGIRFPLPNEGKLNYGKNGPSDILAWGEDSAAYFRSLKLKDAKIIAAGNPRFDEVLSRDYSAEIKKIKIEQNLGAVNILYVSNPIDDQGLGTYQEKMDCFEVFLKRLTSSLKNGELKILVRLHPREDRKAFEDIIDRLQLQEEVLWVQTYPLFACLQVVDFSIILASTVGLESMLCKTPVAVIKLKSCGYVFNYVSSGCALGIDLSEEFSRNLLDAVTHQKAEWRIKCEKYVSNQLSNMNTSAPFISNYITSAISVK